MLAPQTFDDVNTVEQVVVPAGSPAGVYKVFVTAAYVPLGSAYYSLVALGSFSKQQTCSCTLPSPPATAVCAMLLAVIWWLFPLCAPLLCVFWRLTPRTQ